MEKGKGALLARLAELGVLGDVVRGDGEDKRVLRRDEELDKVPSRVWMSTWTFCNWEAEKQRRT